MKKGYRGSLTHIQVTMHCILHGHSVKITCPVIKKKGNPASHQNGKYYPTLYYVFKQWFFAQYVTGCMQKVSVSCVTHDKSCVSWLEDLGCMWIQSMFWENTKCTFQEDVIGTVCFGNFKLKFMFKKCVRVVCSSNYLKLFCFLWLNAG